MRHFLTLKNWQMFLIFLVLGNLHFLGLPLNINVLLVLIFVSIWYYSVGIYLANKESGSADFFKASCFLFPLLWMANYWNFILVQKTPPTSGGPIIFIIAVGSFFTYAYIIWFTSDVLNKGNNNSSRYSGYRFLIILWLILLPIGVLFIQPIVNKTFSQKINNNS